MLEEEIIDKHITLNRDVNEEDISQNSEESENLDEKYNKNLLVRLSHSFILLKSQNQTLIRENEKLIETTRCQNSTIKGLQLALNSLQLKMDELSISHQMYKRLILGDSLLKAQKYARFVSSKNDLNIFDPKRIKEHFFRLKRQSEKTQLNIVKESLKIMSIDYIENEINKIEVPFLERSKSVEILCPVSLEIDLSYVEKPVYKSKNDFSGIRGIKSYDFSSIV